MENKNDTFLKECKEVLSEAQINLSEDWNSMPVKQRVEIENLIIMYVLMLENLKELNSIGLS